MINLHTNEKKKTNRTLKLCVSAYTHRAFTVQAYFLCTTVDVVHTVSEGEVLTGEMANLEYRNQL